MKDDTILTNKEEENTMGEESFGTIVFADDIISTLAGRAAIEIDGVAGMNGKLVDGITEFLGKKNFSKGIEVEVGTEEVKVDINIVVNYGIPIRDICRNVQQSVIKEIEMMTGLHVSAVNVKVQGMIFKDSPVMEEPEEANKNN